MMLRGDVYSQTLCRVTGLTVLGPNDFTPGAPYRVCYLLHGLGGADGDWAQFTLLPYYARSYRVLFVMPEAGRSFYTDMARGGKYFSFVADELPEICRAVFSISGERRDTAVMGVSMGGYGALKCALRRPERYGKAAAFSPPCLYLREDLEILRTPEGRVRAEEIFGEQIPLDLQAAFGDDFAWKEEDDVAELARAANAGTVKPELFLACGESDDFLGSCRRFRNDLNAMGYNLAYEEGAGEHDWLYFNTALEHALRWAYGEPRN